MPPDHARALQCVEPHAGIVGRLVVRLVLDRHRVDRKSLGVVRLNELHEVVGERIVELRQQCSLDQTAGALHPGGRAPRTADQFHLRIDRDREFEQRNLLGPVVVDRESAQTRIALRSRHIVVAVMPERKIRRTHGHSDEAQADAVVTPEEIVHQRVAILSGHAVHDQIRRGVGHGRAEANHLLIGPALIYVDHWNRGG